MTQTAEKILSEAMKLNEAERIELAERLLDNVDSEKDSDYSQAWEAEIRERERQLDSGEVQAIPWEEVRKMMRTDGATDETR